MRRLATLLFALTACGDPGIEWSALPDADAPPPTLFPGLAVSEFLPGEPLDIVVSGIPQSTRVQLFASLNGVQTDYGPCAPLGGGCLDLAPGVVAIGSGRANADGEAIFEVGPAPAFATEVTVQAGAYLRSQSLSGVTPPVQRLLQDADLDGVITADDCDDTDPDAWVWITGYPDADDDGEAATATPVDLCTDGSLPSGYVDVPGADCDDLDALSYPGAVESCDGVADENCDGQVDEGCPSNDPFNTASCIGTPWSSAEAMAHLAGRSRVVLATETIQQRQCPGAICGADATDWTIRYLTWSGGVTTRYRSMDATMNLVLFDDGGSPALSIQHTTFDLGNYPDDDGMVYAFPPSLITYPHVRAFNDTATGYDYVDLDYQVRGTGITYGDGCVRWTAEPFGAPLTHDWAVRFTW